MVVFSVPSTIRSSLIFGCSNIFKRSGFCSSSGYGDRPKYKSDVDYHYDVKEVKHHEAQLKEWWDPNGPMKALHAMNELRIPFIKNGLVNSHRLKALEVKNKVNFLEGIKVLDVGCGGGILSEPLARLGAEVTGIDPSEHLIATARKHAAENLSEEVPAPTYTVETVEQAAQKAMGHYDVVVSSEVIEHVNDKEAFLAACIAALKLGGSLFLTTPNRTLPAWLGGIIMAENVLHAIPKGTHTYSKFIKPAEISALCEKYGCSIQLINGMFYNPVTNRWMWAPTKTFIYALHAIKIKDLFR